MRRSEWQPTFQMQSAADVGNRLFQSLAADKSNQLPYSTDIADQRRKYGESVLRRCDDHLATQRQYENETQARLEEARRKRQEEKDKQDQIEVGFIPATHCRHDRYASSWSAWRRFARTRRS